MRIGQQEESVVQDLTAIITTIRMAACFLVPIDSIRIEWTRVLHKESSVELNAVTHHRMVDCLERNNFKDCGTQFDGSVQRSTLIESTTGVDI
ncbi:hypothetical protein AB6A40_008577 [Gnathostoma spinigerum]|uniref:Uncharacterized protein n=1 Tax=Gnathostoma spinigerum TaxID=75299 RepID=A0ABD6EXR5_9BILA